MKLLERIRDAREHPAEPPAMRRFRRMQRHLDVPPIPYRSTIPASWIVEPTGLTPAELHDVQLAEALIRAGRE